jgi:hypothetical protein
MRNVTEKTAKQNKLILLSKNEENMASEKRMKKLKKIWGK